MTVDDRDEADSRRSGAPGSSDGDAFDSPVDRCRNCGAALPDGAMFCGECGSAVGPRSAAGEPDESAEAAAATGAAAGAGAAGGTEPGGRTEPGGGADAAGGTRMQPVADPNESGAPPHGDALLDRSAPSAAGTAAPARRVPDSTTPQHPTDQEDSGLPPHGDALLEPSDAASAPSGEAHERDPGAADGASALDATPGHADDAGEDADRVESDGGGDGGDGESDGDGSSGGDGDSGGGDSFSDGDSGGDGAPTAVQPVVGAESDSPASGDLAPARADSADSAAGGGFATEAREPADDDSIDPLAPLTPGERFAAEKLLDPDSPADKFVLQFSTGESATVYGSGLVGRNPVAEPGEYVDHLVVIRDPGRSVSKTHLEFGQASGSFWVLDRFSGNGSVLRPPDGPPKRCEPGRRYVVARGTRVDIGDQFFVVS